MTATKRSSRRGGASELGYAETTVNTPSTSTSPSASTDAVGLTQPVVVGDRAVVVEAEGRAISSSAGAGTVVTMQIVETDTKTNLGTTTSSAVVTGTGFGSGPWVAKAAVSIPNVAAGTTILSVDSPTQITLSANASANGTGVVGTANHRITDCVRTSRNANDFQAAHAKRRINPAPGAHTYKVQIHSDTAGTTTLYAAPDSTAPGSAPAYLHIYEVP